MLPHLEFDGIDRSAAVEATVQRWLHRLEPVEPIASCFARIRVESYLFGFGKRACIELALAAGSDRIDVMRVVKFRAHDDLYFLISDAFREARRQLLRARGTGPLPASAALA
jgi:hypothetical protein